jgi:hypothetical protein
MTVKIPPGSVEALQTVVTSSADLTGVAPTWGFIPTGTTSDPGAFVAGSWESAYSAGKATAATPTLGVTGTGATVELDAGTWDAYVRLSNGPEAPVRKVDKVTIEPAFA